MEILYQLMLQAMPFFSPIPPPSPFPTVYYYLKPFPGTVGLAVMKGLKNNQ